MGIFRKIFGKEYAAPIATTPDRQAGLAPGGRGYDPMLIPSLQDDHARLRALFTRIGQLAERGEYAEVRTLLGHFKSSLQAHLLTENGRFYAYLERSFAEGSGNARMIREFRRDMNAIARHVVAFVKAWQKSDFATRPDRETFSSDYKRVHELLDQRLDSEEHQLYPLYKAYPD